MSSACSMDQQRRDMLKVGVRWFDDWFALREVAPGVHAIGEPRFHQINWNYLIVGEDRALLFDTGPGVRDISVVVRSLTSLPVVALPSHLHFDHTGNLHLFADIAMPDLPELRACERNGEFHASDELFRGFREGMVWNPCKVSRWWPIGHRIELGRRSLEILHTPGHSPDSISLMDHANNVLLAADFIYQGALYAQIPGADLSVYQQTANRLLNSINTATRTFGAHGQADKNDEHDAPELRRSDVADLAKSLELLRQSGTMPATWPVNDSMHLLTWPPAFASWQNA